MFFSAYRLAAETDTLFGVEDGTLYENKKLS